MNTAIIHGQMANSLAQQSARASFIRSTAPAIVRQMIASGAWRSYTDPTTRTAVSPACFAEWLAADVPHGLEIDVATGGWMCSGDPEVVKMIDELLAG